MKKKGNKYIQKEVNTATPIEPYLELPSSQRKKENGNHTNTSNQKNWFVFILQPNLKGVHPKENILSFIWKVFILYLK